MNIFDSRLYQECVIKNEKKKKEVRLNSRVIPRLVKKNLL